MIKQYKIETFKNSIVSGVDLCESPFGDSVIVCYLEEIPLTGDNDATQEFART